MNIDIILKNVTLEELEKIKSLLGNKVKETIIKNNRSEEKKSSKTAEKKKERASYTSEDVIKKSTEVMGVFEKDDALEIIQAVCDKVEVEKLGDIENKKDCKTAIELMQVELDKDE